MIQNNAPSHIERLPVEILTQVVGLLSPEAAVVLRRVKPFRERVNWSMLQGPNRREDIVKEAASRGFQTLVEWLINKQICDKTNVCVYALKAGQLKLFKWAYAKGYPFSVEAYIQQTQKVHSKTLNWIELTSKDGRSPCFSYTSIAEKAHQRLLDLFVVQGTIKTNKLTIYQFIKDKVMALKNTKEEEQWTESDKQWADLGRSYSNFYNQESAPEMRLAFEKLYEIGCQTVEKNHLEQREIEILKKIRSQLPNDESVCYFAAANGHFLILQWAQTNGFSLHVDTCSVALENGHLKIWKWLCTQGVDWNIINFNLAQDKFLNLIQQAYSEGTIMRHVHGHAIHFYAAFFGYLNVLNWTLRTGFEISFEDVMNIAIENNKNEVIDWVNSSRVEGMRLNVQSNFFIRNDGQIMLWDPSPLANFLNQEDLDNWIREYNESRTDSGKYCYGKTHLQAFLKSKHLAHGKMLDRQHLTDAVVVG